MAAIRTPSTIAEFRRIAHAFLVGSRIPAGETAYIVMSTEPPLYPIQGIYSTPEEAQEAIAHSELSMNRWTSAEKTSRGIYQTVVPDLSRANELVMFDEGVTTDPDKAVPNSELDAATKKALRYENVEKLELRLTVKGKVVTYPLPAETTVLFITRGAAETFLFSQYYAYFGPEYADVQMKRMLKTH